MSAAPARNQGVDLGKSQTGAQGAVKAPRPDCAIWNDIARALGAKSEQSK